MHLSDLLNYRLPPINYGRIIRLIFGVVVVLILLTAVNKKQADYIAGLKIDIRPLDNGNRLLSENDVKKRITLAFGNALLSTEIGNLELRRIEEVIEQDLTVANAEAYIDQKGIVHIRVEQREPILRVLDNSGGNYYLDKTGAMMPFSYLHTPRVLVATGNIAHYSADFLERQNTLRDAFRLAQMLQDDPILSAFIQQIHVNNANEFILVPLVGDQKIVFGKLRNAEDKLRRLKIFYKEGMTRVGWRTYETISLKYDGQVLCRR